MLQRFDIIYSDQRIRFNMDKSASFCLKKKKISCPKQLFYDSWMNEWIEN